MILKDLLNQLQTIEQRSPDSPLVFYEPGKDDLQFYHDLCQAYRTASPQQRAQIEEAVRRLEGVVNNLLGYVYACARRVRQEKSREWLQVGLEAAALRGEGPDFRDYQLALAELRAAALEAGIETIQ